MTLNKKWMRLMVLVGCAALTASCKQAPVAQMEAEYAVLKVSPSDKVLSTTYSATIRGRQDIDIYPQVSGFLTRLCVEEGQAVRKGQVLFIIDQVPYKAALETAVANVESAKAGLATAELIGNIVKTNASISGAEAGCQAEVGVACSMASAAANQLFGGSPAQIEYAAEMGLEHHLGMTCDPVCGLVQIPCIERNAYAAARALDANLYSSFTDGMHRVSFDKVVEVMKETGNDLPSLYKETSEGGLAKDYKPM